MGFRSSLDFHHALLRCLYGFRLAEYFEPETPFAVLYSVQWILNSAWSPVFFRYHMVNWGLIIILALTALIAYFLFAQRSRLKAKTVFVLPYFLWLLIAVSLNAYISLEN